MRVIRINPDLIAFFQTAQVSADIGHTRIGQKIGRIHRAGLCCDTQNRRIEIHIAVLDAVQAVEKHIVAGDRSARRNKAVFSAYIDANGLDQNDVLIFFKCIEVTGVEIILAHREGLFG